jgi:S-adenosyl methyltransferase
VAGQSLPGRNGRRGPLRALSSFEAAERGRDLAERGAICDIWRLNTSLNVRSAARQAVAAYPDMPSSVRANRAFLARAVRYLTREAGIRQFLDIGTGIPTANNTHEVAQAAAPESRVVYVDNDRCKSGCSHAGGAPPRPLCADTRVCTYWAVHVHRAH